MLFSLSLFYQTFIESSFSFTDEAALWNQNKKNYSLRPFLYVVLIFQRVKHI